MLDDNDVQSEATPPFLRALLFCGAVAPGQVGQDVLSVLDAIEADEFPFSLECVAWFRWANLPPGDHVMRVDVLDPVLETTSTWLEVSLSKDTPAEHDIAGSPMAHLHAEAPTTLWFQVFLDDVEYGWFPMPFTRRNPIGMVDES